MLDTRYEIQDAKKRILIVRTDRLGDVILSTPVIKNLRAAYPGARIAFMCRPYTKDILAQNPYLDEVIVYDKYGRHKSIYQSIKFALALRKNKFDWALILHPTNRAHLMTYLAGIPLRIGWDRKMGFLLTQKLPDEKHRGQKHELEYTLDILRKLNIPVIDKTTLVPVKKEAQEKIDRLLEEKGVGKDEKIIVIHPGASCPSKRWPAQHFSRLVKLLKEKVSLPVAVIAAEEESASGEKTARENEVIDLRGKLDIVQVSALIRRAALFISNDSGPVHIAASFPVPVISIFGRKDKGLSPQRWKPTSKNSFYFHKDAGCTPCLAHNCRRQFSCLAAITPEEVAQKALSLLKTKC